MSGASKPPQPPRREHGLALVIVLWTLTLLAVIATEFAYSTRIEAKLARNVVDTATTRQLAQAGVARGLYGILHPDPAVRWRADGTTYQFPMHRAVIQVTVRDETAFIDLNAAQAGLLDGLFRVAGVKEPPRQSLVDAILDWRDKDSLRRLNGAEDDDYTRAGFKYRAKDARFDAVAELMLVAGMSPALYRKVEPWLTIHSGRAGINRDTAPREVLLAMPGADPGEVEATIAARSNSEAAGAQRTTARQTGAFRITARASLPSGVAKTLTVVVRVGVQRVKAPRVSVLDWRER